MAEFLGLVEVLDGHGHHVEEDEDHDEDVKLLARGYVEQDQLALHLVENVVNEVMMMTVIKMSVGHDSLLHSPLQNHNKEHNYLLY